MKASAALARSLNLVRLAGSQRGGAAKSPADSTGRRRLAGTAAPVSGARAVVNQKGKRLIMDRKEFKKILGGSISSGLVALGAYNLYWFVYYFMHGRDISVIPPKMQLLLADIFVVVVTAVIVMLLDIISRKLHRNRQTDSEESGK